MDLMPSVINSNLREQFLRELINYFVLTPGNLYKKFLRTRKPGGSVTKERFAMKIENYLSRDNIFVLSTGAIIGISIGALIVIAIIIFIVLRKGKKKGKKKRKK